MYIKIRHNIYTKIVYSTGKRLYLQNFFIISKCKFRTSNICNLSKKKQCNFINDFEFIHLFYNIAPRSWKEYVKLGFPVSRVSAVHKIFLVYFGKYIPHNSDISWFWIVLYHTRYGVVTVLIKMLWIITIKTYNI